MSYDDISLASWISQFIYEKFKRKKEGIRLAYDCEDLSISFWDVKTGKQQVKLDDLSEFVKGCFLLLMVLHSSDQSIQFGIVKLENQLDMQISTTEIFQLNLRHNNPLPKEFTLTLLLQGIDLRSLLIKGKHFSNNINEYYFENMKKSSIYLKALCINFIFKKIFQTTKLINYYKRYKQFLVLLV